MSDEPSIPLEKLTDPEDDLDSYFADGAEGTPLPELPDGIGLSYNDIVSILRSKHKSHIDVTEPTLMLVTVCNVFLGELLKLHKRHNEALSTIIAGKTQEYITGVKQTTDAFTQTLADASVEGVRRIFEDHAAVLQAHQGNTRWCALIVAISALANLAVLALR